MKGSHALVITSCWFLFCLLAAAERVENGEKRALLRRRTEAKAVLQRRGKHPNVVLKVKKSINHKRNGRKTENGRRSSKRQFLPSLYQYFHPRVHRIVVHHHAGKMYIVIKPTLFIPVLANSPPLCAVNCTCDVELGFWSGKHTCTCYFGCCTDHRQTTCKSKPIVITFFLHWTCFA